MAFVTPEILPVVDIKKAKFRTILHLLPKGAI